MGLDITAYSNIKKDEENGEVLGLYSTGFIQSNLKEFETNYEILDEDGEVIEPLLTCDDGYGFRAGSYGGYGEFRRILCTAINEIDLSEMWENDNKISIQNLPFFWLLNFSDCEGYIGTDYCKILYKDFVNNEDKFREAMKEFEDYGQYYIDTYLDFKNALEVASNNGVLSFH